MNLLLIFSIFLSFYIGVPEEQVTLEVKIENARNNKGYLLASLYNSRTGYPDDPTVAFRLERIKAGSDDNQFSFKDIPPGTYALAILHDENNNGELDTNILGIPGEGYGSSNNVQKMFRAPNFEESKFQVGDKDQQLTIQLNYY